MIKHVVPTDCAALPSSVWRPPLVDSVVGPDAASVAVGTLVELLV